MESSKQEKAEKEKEREEVKEITKKPYSQPQLTKYGDVEEFTGVAPYGDLD